MEIQWQRRRNKHNIISKNKVRSHIDIDKALDKVFWKVNDKADGFLKTI